MNTKEKIADLQRQLDALKRDIESPKLVPIDWGTVKPGMLVMAWDYGVGKALREYREYCPKSTSPHRTRGLGDWKHASLETGHWIFNHSGENPWPDGVMVEFWLRGSASEHELRTHARRLRWGLAGDNGDIIASRCVGLEEWRCW